MKPSYSILLLFGLFFILHSCTKDKVDASACNTTEVTYTDEIASIMNASCAIPGCHNGDQPPLLVDFTSTSTASTGSSFLPRIRHDEGFSAMPPDGSKLDQCEIDIITAWIADGSPE